MTPAARPGASGQRAHLGDRGQALLGHGTGHFLGPALLWSVALVVVFGSTAVALFRRS